MRSAAGKVAYLPDLAGLAAAAGQRASYAVRDASPWPHCHRDRVAPADAFPPDYADSRNTRRAISSTCSTVSAVAGGSCTAWVRSRRTSAEVGMCSDAALVLRASARDAG